MSLLLDNTPKLFGAGEGKNSSNSPTNVMTNWVEKTNPFYHAMVYNTDGNDTNYAAQNGVQYWSNVYDYITPYYCTIGSRFNKLNIAQTYSSSQSAAYYNYNNSYCHLSDLMIFDAALDLNTIRQIQGIS